MSFFSDSFRNVKKFIRHTPEGNNAAGTWTGTVTKDVQIDECPFVVFDTELSGLNPRTDFIVSFGAVKMTGGTIHISKEFYRLIKPEGEMKHKSVEIHGITPDELEDQGIMDKALPDFLDFIKDSVLVGHFVHIDLAFLKKVLRQKFNRKLTNPAVDTHSLHEWLSENGVAFKRHYRGGSSKTDLFSVARHYGIVVDAAHNALNDAFLTAQLFQKFLYFLRAESMHTLNDLLDIGRA